MNSVLSLRRWYKSESASLLYGQGGRENKSWSCVAAPVALKTDRDERSSSPVSVVKLQDRSRRRIAPAESTEAIRSIRSNGLIEPIRSSNKSRSSYTIAM